MYVVDVSNSGMNILWFFFFQAEDGIRDVAVTGVQTCALPISPRRGAGWWGDWSCSWRRVHSSICAWVQNFSVRAILPKSSSPLAGTAYSHSMVEGGFEL